MSGLYRLVNDDAGMQVDFLSTVHGIRSFESLRARSVEVEFDGAPLRVANLGHIIASKKALGRERNKAVLAILERTLHEKKNLEGEAARSPEKGK